MHESSTIPSPARPPDAAPTLLIVEDHADSARALAIALSTLGCHTLVARTAKKARDALDASPPALLLTDIKLPDGSGVDLMREARLHHGVQSIAISGGGLGIDRDALVDAGFAAYVPKPVDLAVLLDVVRRLLPAPKK